MGPKRMAAALLMGVVAGLGASFTSTSTADALPPNPIQPWGGVVSAYAVSTPTDPCYNGINALPVDPCRGLNIAALARVSSDR